MDAYDNLFALLKVLSIAAQLWVAIMASIAIHELGHWMVGRLLGLRVERVQIGASPWHKPKGSSHNTFYGTKWGFGWWPIAGYVTATGVGKPPALRALPDHDFRAHGWVARVWYLMAGMINQLLCAVVCMVIIAHMDGAHGIGGMLHHAGSQYAQVARGLWNVWFGPEGTPALLHWNWEPRQLLLVLSLHCLLQSAMQLTFAPKMDSGLAAQQFRVPRNRIEPKGRRTKSAVPAGGYRLKT